MQSILIVEDNLMIADMVEEMLVQNGYSVCGTAMTATEGVALCRRHKPDLALVDLRLAGGEMGTEIAAQLTPFRNLGILYATGNISEVVLTRADGHARIKKPYLASDLLHALQLVTEIAATGVATPPFPAGFLALPHATGGPARGP